MRMYIKIVWGLFILFPLFGQLVVNSGIPPTTLVNNYLLSGGVNASNIVFNGPNISIGYFDGSASNINLDEGIIIATGNVNDAVGPNNSPSTGTDLNLPGDPQLTALTTTNTFDAVSLEFDFVPTGDTIRFRYVFASEEYCEFACGTYNDVFAFFLSGPGITGAQNIAVIPGTNPPQPVTIRNVNAGDCSTTPPTQCGGNPLYYIDNTNGNNPDPTSVQYDGFTVVLEAIAKVIPCSTYHIKIAIADAGDGIYDSAVFLEAGSFRSNGVNVVADAPEVGINGQPVLPEGCATAEFNINLSNSFPDTTVFYFNVSGTATNGVDYQYIPDSIVIPPGVLNVSIPIIPIVDNIPEGDETVIITLTGGNFSSCFSNLSDTLIIRNVDSLVVETNPDKIAIKCGNDNITLSANSTGGIGPITYTWQPGGLTGSSINVNPSSNTMYYVIATDTCGNTATDSVLVKTFPELIVDIVPTTIDICEGSPSAPVPVNVSGGTGPISYVWFPTAGVSNPTIKNPTLNPSSTQTYYLYSIDSVGCISDTDSVVVNVNPIPIVDAGPDTGLCAGNGVQLYANVSGGSGTYDYSWSPTNSLSNPNVSNPYATPSTSTIYSVVVTDQNTGCSAPPEYVTVLVGNKPIADAGPDKTICVGDSVTIGGAPSGYIGTLTFSWSPTIGLDDPTKLYPKASPPSTTTYFLTVYDNGCASDADEVTVFVEPMPVLANAIPSFQEICPGDSVKLEVTGTLNPPYTIYWIPSTGLSNPNILEPWAFPDTTTDYFLNVISGPCRADSIVRYRVSVKDVAKVYADSTGKGYVYFCKFDTNGVQLPAKIEGDYSSFSWKPSVYLSSSSDLNPFASPPYDINYILEVNSKGCIIRDTIKVLVLSAPDIVIETDKSEYCSNDTITLIAKGGAGNATFIWNYYSIIDTTDTLIIPANITPDSVIKVYISAYELSKFCMSKDSIEIRVHPYPYGEFYVAPKIQCTGNDVSYVIIRPENLIGYNVKWYTGDGNIIYGYPVNYVYQQPGNYNVKMELYYIGDSTCRNIQEYPIHIVESAKANFYSVPRPNDTLYLPNTTVEFYDSSLGEVKYYYWYFGDGGSSREINPKYTYKHPGEYEVMLIAEDFAGCRDTVVKRFYIIKVPTMEPIPNVFTPNNDGVNDIFKVNYKGTEEFSLQIFDRWGKLVYETKNPSEGWNGILPNGQEASEGTYFYIIRVDKEIYKGSFVLIR